MNDADIIRGNPADIAKAFHEAYERLAPTFRRLAPTFSYETRKESAVAWEDVPEMNRALMTAVCGEVVGNLVAALDRIEAALAEARRDAARWCDECNAAEAALRDALAALDRIEADRQKAWGLYDVALRDHVSLIRQAEAAEAERDRLREAIASAMGSLATGPARDGYAYYVLGEALSAALAAPTKPVAGSGQDWQSEGGRTTPGHSAAPTKEGT